MVGGESGAHADVTICVCTYGRSSVRETLRSLLDAHTEEGLAIAVVVADNNLHPTAWPIVEAFGAEAPFPVRYVHVPAGNIALARNACLDASEGEWLAFIDDDEVADAGWLDALLRQGESADVIVGPVLARYPAEAADWQRRGDFHSIRERCPLTLGRNAYCGNVLIRRSLVEQCGARFDLAFGRSGGEDTAFFACLERAGARFALSVGAIVREDVPAGRLGLRYLLTRALRNGHVFARVHGANTHALAAACKLLWLLASGLLRAGDPVAWRRSAIRGGFHVGVLREKLGLRPAPAYGASDPAPRGYGGIDAVSSC
ncbi:glycosyl transferase family A [Alsobacter soli]|uniref:Glycosyl transferase family A n=1 Tax=Alsobacter soli TaxID=2109933 RepID=A0A2T1HNA3_9HYPH|nr:glycosyltransferase family 2 protein [Alsobacter soli]PSC03118.1 glycosyl transferase family A [Alsobacter soli]